jgi:AraC-like DNA-binding protein
MARISVTAAGQRLDAATLTAAVPRMASVSQVSVRLFAPFVDVVARLGLNAKAALACVGLPTTGLADSELRVGHDVLERLLRMAVANCGARGLGLFAAEETRPEHLDVLEYIARSQATLGDALQSIEKFAALLHDALHVKLDVAGDRAEVRVTLAGQPLPECAHEFTLAMLLLATRRITGLPAMQVCEVRFAHARPSDTSQHQDLFRSPLAFGQEQTALVLPRSMLALRLPAADEGLARVLEQYAVTKLRRLGEDKTLPERVRSIVRQKPSLGRTTAAGIAQQFGVSSRTLQRRLAAHGGYRRIIEEVHREVALNALRDPQCSTQAVADLLGFNYGAFQRAFRRWTGQTPVQYQKSASQHHSVGGSQSA